MRGLQARSSSCVQPLSRPLLSVCRAPVSSGVLQSRGHLACRAVNTQADNDVTIQVSVKRHTGFGQCVKLVGGCEALGNWKPAQGVTLKWSEGDVWRGAFNVPPGTPLEFKVVVYTPETKETEWEEAGNKVLQVPQQPGRLVAKLGWGVAEVPSPAFVPVGGAAEPAARLANGAAVGAGSRSPSPVGRAPSPNMATRGTPTRSSSPLEAATDALLGAAETVIFGGEVGGAGRPAVSVSPASTERVAVGAATSGRGGGRGKPAGVRTGSAVRFSPDRPVDPITSFASVDDDVAVSEAGGFMAPMPRRTGKKAKKRGGSPGNVSAKATASAAAFTDMKTPETLEEAEAQWQMASGELKRQVAALRARSRSKSRSPGTASADLDEPMERTNASLGAMLGAVGPHEKDAYEASGRRSPSPPVPAPARANTPNKSSQAPAAVKDTTELGQAQSPLPQPQGGVEGGTAVVEGEGAGEGQGQMVLAASLTLVAGLAGGYAYLLQQGVDLGSLLPSGSAVASTTALTRTLPASTPAVADVVGDATTAFAAATNQASDALMGAMKGTSDILAQSLDAASTAVQTSLDAASTAASSAAKASMDMANAAVSSSVEAANSALEAASSMMEDAGSMGMDVLATQSFSMEDALSALKLDSIAEQAMDAMDSATEALSDAVSAVNLSTLTEQLSDQLESVGEAVTDTFSAVSLPALDFEDITDTARDSFETMGAAVSDALDLDNLADQAESTATESFAAVTDAVEEAAERVDLESLAEKAQASFASGMEAVSAPVKETVTSAVTAGGDAAAEPAVPSFADAAEDAADAVVRVASSDASALDELLSGTSLSAVADAPEATAGSLASMGSGGGMPPSAVDSIPDVPAAVNLGDVAAGAPAKPAPFICLAPDHPIVSSILGGSGDLHPDVKAVCVDGAANLPQ